MLLLRIILCAILSIVVSSCGDDTKTAASKDTIVVATSADNPPYEFIQDGKVVGLDIDIMEAIAKELGKKLVVKNFDFPGLLPALTSKNVDAVIAALTVTDERKTRVDFSEGYASTSMAVLFRKGDDLKSTNDLSSKVVGVLMGTTWESYAKGLAEKIPNLRIRSLSNNLVLVEELKSGTVDALIMEEMQVNQFMTNISGLSSFTLDNTKGEFAIALPKDSTLTPLINQTIKTLFLNGSLNEIKTKWLVK
jgi:polar amino acid transport system substrate-binding protein